MVLPTSALAAGRTTARIDVPVLRLQDALAMLARQTGTEILYDQTLVAGLRSHLVKGPLTVAGALRSMLAGTSLVFRATSDGTYFLTRRAPAVPVAATPPPPPPAVPDILVLGRRTQDADIRRTENDIQPYQVIDRHALERSAIDTPDDYLRTRITANTQFGSASQTGMSGRSEVDLRGLGSNQTLMLVDGRRMPSVAIAGGYFEQPDINGIPLSAIARIETLTGTAGGIYGPGALGGVVNIVLRQDYSGLELHATSGITDRGDARSLRLEGFAGLAVLDGALTITLGAMRTFEQPLLDTHAGLISSSRELLYPSGRNALDLTASNAINISSVSGNLQLKPQFGGQVLSAGHTFLPLGFEGTVAERDATLIANAGHLDVDVPAHAGLTESYLSLRNERTSGLVNIRGKISDSLTVYADGIYAADHGRYDTPAGQIIGAAYGGQAYDPFVQPIYYAAPAPGQLRKDVRTSSARLSTGLIAKLSSRWSASLDGTLGDYRTTIDEKGDFYGSKLLTQYFAVSPSTPDPRYDPFGSYTALISGLRHYLDPISSKSTRRDRLRDISLKVAGILWRLPAGPTTLTLLGETRTEVNPSTQSSDGNYIDLSRYEQDVNSAYMELRMPLLGRGPTTFFLLKGLELQGAIRFDRLRQTYPIASEIDIGVPGLLGYGDDRRSSTTFTAGARLFPARWLMIRASVATGTLPPTVQQLAPIYDSITAGSTSVYTDPRRGNEYLGTSAPLVEIMNGSPTVRSERARTIETGFVINPDGKGPRISADFSRIRVSNGIDQNYIGDLQAIVADENAFPGLVTRAPLSSADAAKGYTGGPITRLDAANFNGITTVVDAVDVMVNWHMRFSDADGLEFFGSLTWHPRYQQYETATNKRTDLLDFTAGAMRLRAAGGLEWTRCRWETGFEFQWYPRYMLGIPGSDFVGVSPGAVLQQGSAFIPSQTYVDIFVARNIHLPSAIGGRPLSVRLGIENLFDRLPPLVVSTASQGYSLYGDPRGRRFQLQVSTRF